MDQPAGGKHDYHMESELSTVTCTAKVHGANSYCTHLFPESPQRWACDLCGVKSNNTNFTAIFLDQNARELRQTTVDVIKRFKQTSVEQAEHMVNDRFTTVYRECKAPSLWEICHRCCAQMHKGNEDYFVET